MASVLEDFVVRLGFKVDQDQLAKFKHSVAGLSKTMVGVGAAIAAGIVNASKEAHQLIVTTSRTNTSITGLKTLRDAFKQVSNDASGADQAVQTLATNLKKFPDYAKFIEQTIPGVSVMDKKTGKLRDMADVIRDISDQAQKMEEHEARAALAAMGFNEAAIDTLLDKDFPGLYDKLYEKNLKLTKGLEDNAARLKKIDDAYNRFWSVLSHGSTSILGKIVEATDLDKDAEAAVDHTEKSLNRIGNFVDGWKKEGDYRATARAAWDSVTKMDTNARRKAAWTDDQIKFYAELTEQPIEKVRKEVEEARKRVAELDRINATRAQKAQEARKQSISLLEQISKNTDPESQMQIPGGKMTPVPLSQRVGEVKPGAPPTGSRKDRIMKAVSILKNQEGFTDEQAAGFVGVLLAESNLDPTARRKGGSDSGLLQWTGKERQASFWRTHARLYSPEKSAQYGGDILKVPLEEQLRVAANERPEIIKKLKRQKTVDQAVYVTMMGLQNGSPSGLATVEGVDRAFSPFGNSWEKMYAQRLRHGLTTYDLLKSQPKPKPKPPEDPAAYTPPSKADIKGVLKHAWNNRDKPVEGKKVSDAGATVNISNIFNGAADPEKVQDAVEDGIKTAYDRIGARYSVNASFG